MLSQKDEMVLDSDFISQFERLLSRTQRAAFADFSLSCLWTNAMLAILD